MTIRAVVRGSGHYLPERVVPNSWFEDKLDTSDEWIVARTGIERRHFAAEGQGTSDLATRAATAALEDAGLAAASTRSSWRPRRRISPSPRLRRWCRAHSA